MTGLSSLEIAVAETGLLLLHDQDLPSATRLIAGEVVHGSWWGHPAGKAIFSVLQSLGDDIREVKLVKGKVTLIHRRLWPAVLGIATSGEPWQTARLHPDAADLLERVRAEGELDSGEIDLPLGSRKSGTVVTDLERRLLLITRQVHTDKGHHARILQTWALGWPDVDPLPPAEAKAVLETAAINPAVPLKRLFPW